MISAVYMVCAMELGGCIFFVDQPPYETLEECQLSAQRQIELNALAAAAGEMIPHTAVYKCISWENI